MSELNVYHHELRPNEYAEFYLKYQADEVIAELKSDIADLRDDKKLTDAILDERNAEIAELKEKLKNSRNARKYWMKEYSIEHKECLHQKYKRCLAMAMWCEAEAQKCLTQQGAMIGFPWTDRFQYLQWQITHYSRWHRIWLKLAEKFKEAK